MLTARDVLARDLIARWEGLRLDAYLDTGGVPTIGVGHAGPEVRLGQTITHDEAMRLLAADMQWASQAVDDLVTVPLTDGQAAALTSWIFNVGRGAAATSTLIRRLNAGEYDAVPYELSRWNKDNGRVIQGLVNRRADEAALFAKSLPTRPPIEPDIPDPPEQFAENANSPAPEPTPQPAPKPAGFFLSWLWSFFR